MRTGEGEAFDEVLGAGHLLPGDRVVIHGMGITVDAALPGAHIVGHRDGRLDFEFDDAVPEVHFRDFETFLDHLVRKAALQVEVLVFRDGLEGVDQLQRRDGQLSVPFRDAVRVRVVETDGRDVVVRLGQVETVLPDDVRVEGVAREGRIVRDAVLFRGPFDDHDDGDRADREPAGVDHLDGLRRDFGRGFDHLGVDLVRVCGGHDVIRVDHIATGRADTGDLAVLDEDLFDFLAELELGAVLLDLLLHLHGHLMGIAPADVGAGQVVRHEEGVNGEGQVVEGVADVDPVRRHQLFETTVDAAGRHDLRGAVAQRPDEVGVFHQHLDLAHLVGGQVVHAVIDPAHHLDEVEHFVITAGNGGIEVAGRSLVTVMDRHVDVLTGHDDAVAFRHFQPVDVDAHLIEERADFQPVFVISDGHHLMQGGFDFETVSDEVCGKSAGQVVFFENEDVFDAPFLKTQRTRHTGKAATHDDHLVMVFVKTHGAGYLPIASFDDHSG